MPWNEVKPMDQKLLFIADHIRELGTFADRCDRYGSSRTIAGPALLDLLKALSLSLIFCPSLFPPVTQPERSDRRAKQAED